MPKTIKIVAHTVVRNEENWLWFAIKSVIGQVSAVTLWDTGSTDRTPEIIKSLSHPKISTKFLDVTPDETALSKVRQQMLDQTRADWLMILDGDEVWPTASLKKVLSFISKNGQKYDSIVVPTLNCVGDVFHISPPSQGKYTIAGKTGHYNLRFINLKKVPGLHIANTPGHLQSYYDGKNIRLQDRDPEKIAFVDAPYFHLTHLPRSANRRNEINVFWRANKRKYQLGRALPENISLPECFYMTPPPPVPSPLKKRSVTFVLIAALADAARWLKYNVLS